MKRTFALLLFASVVLAFTVAANAAAQAPVNNIEAFTVSADPAYTAPTRVIDSKLTKRLHDLIEQVELKSETSAGFMEIARFAIEFSDGVKGDYTLFIKKEQGFLRFAGRNYNIDIPGLYALLADIDGFYKHKGFPPLTIEAGGSIRKILPSGGSVSYKRLDGLFHDLTFAAQETEPIIIQPDELSLPLPVLPPDSQSALLKVSQGERIVFYGDPDHMPRLDLSEKELYQADLTTSRASDYYKGVSTYTYQVEMLEGIGTDFSVDANNLFPGEILILRTQGKFSGQNADFQSDFPFTPAFFDYGKERIALLPVSFYVAPGDYYVRFTRGDVTKKIDININYKEFPVQRMTASTETMEQTINSQKANDEYTRVITPLCNVSDQEKHWEGRFTMPVSGGRISTEFGAIRYVNGIYRSRHGGLDVALPTGVPVAASNSGRVLYAGYLQLIGNTVLIEHGFGLKTWYYHMNSLAVGAGDFVKKGQKIGEVGSTGFSTGPHLHFAMSVNAVFVNPYTAIETDLL